jgi:hypothetical protein
MQKIVYCYPLTALNFPALFWIILTSYVSTAEDGTSYCTRGRVIKVALRLAFSKENKLLAKGEESMSRMSSEETGGIKKYSW